MLAQNFMVDSKTQKHYSRTLNRPAGIGEIDILEQIMGWNRMRNEITEKV